MHGWVAVQLQSVEYPRRTRWGAVLLLVPRGVLWSDTMGVSASASAQSGVHIVRSETPRPHTFSRPPTLSQHHHGPSTVATSCSVQTRTSARLLGIEHIFSIVPSVVLSYTLCNSTGRHFMYSIKHAARQRVGQSAEPAINSPHQHRLSPHQRGVAVVYEWRAGGPVRITGGQLGVFYVPI